MNANYTPEEDEGELKPGQPECPGHLVYTEVRVELTETALLCPSTSWPRPRTKGVVAVLFRSVDQGAGPGDWKTWTNIGSILLLLDRSGIRAHMVRFMEGQLGEENRL